MSELLLKLTIDGSEASLSLKAAGERHRSLCEPAIGREREAVRLMVRWGAFLLQVWTQIPYGQRVEFVRANGCGNVKTAYRAMNLASRLADVHGELDEGKLIAAIRAYNTEAEKLGVKLLKEHSRSTRTAVAALKPPTAATANPPEEGKKVVSRVGQLPTVASEDEAAMYEASFGVRPAVDPTLAAAPVFDGFEEDDFEPAEDDEDDFAGEFVDEGDDEGEQSDNPLQESAAAGPAGVVVGAPSMPRGTDAVTTPAGEQIGQGKAQIANGQIANKGGEQMYFDFEARKCEALEAAQWFSDRAISVEDARAFAEWYRGVKARQAKAVAA